MNPKTALILILIATSLVLAACSGGNHPPPNSNRPTPTPTQPPTATPAIFSSPIITSGPVPPNHNHPSGGGPPKSKDANGDPVLLEISTFSSPPPPPPLNRDTLGGFGVGGTPSLSILKETSLGSTKTISLGGTVGYTITLQNWGDSQASNIVMTDTLPEGVNFDQWVQLPSLAIVVGEILTWTGAVSPVSTINLDFTVIVTTNDSFAGQEIINTARYQSWNGGSGSATVSFSITGGWNVYIPLVLK